MKTATSLLVTLMVFVSVTASDAAPKRADGGKCDSTGTGRKTGTDDQGNKMDCLWDTCTFTTCDTSGAAVSNCVKKTEYSNARDCKAAAQSGIKGTRSPGKVKGVLQNMQ